jgi:hypothetical protein
MPPVNGADDVQRVLEPLPFGGKRSPNGVGTRPNVKEVWDERSVRQLWDYLTRNATDCDGPPGFKGPVRLLPDGTRIGLRQSSQGWGDTIQAWYPDGSGPKVHTPYSPYFPSIDASPQLPPTNHRAPGFVMPPRTAHAPTTLPPSGIFEPSGLPPWLVAPSTEVPHTPVQAPTIMPGVLLPETASTSPTGTAGPDILPEIRHDLAEAGRTAGAGVLAGLAVVGGLIASELTPSGQIAR